jgi:predicted HAD superfamily Cof-like phosphohydrolase
MRISRKLQPFRIGLATRKWGHKWTPATFSVEDIGKHEGNTKKPTNMTPEQQSVREFHRVFGATINEKPTEPTPQDMYLRYNLIMEELCEYFGASYRQHQEGAKADLIEVADALGDLLYVVYGAGITYGIDLEPVFKEIHRSNMSKLWRKADVSHIRTGWTVESVNEAFCIVKNEHGKIMKPATWSPPDIAGVLRAQAEWGRPAIGVAGPHR